MRRKERDNLHVRFDETYFTRESTYAKFRDAETARNSLTAWYQSLFRLLAKRYPSFIPTENLVLEIGCGYGAILQLLTARGLNPIGTDISHFALSTIDDSLLRSRLFVCDAETLALRSESVSSIIALEVLEHLPSPDRALIQMFKVLRIDGCLIATTPNPHGNMFPLYNWRADPTHISVLTPARWRFLLSNVGFRHVHVETIFTIPFLWRISQGLGRTFHWSKRGPTCLLLARK